MFRALWTAILAILLASTITTVAHAGLDRHRPKAPYGLTRVIVDQWRKVNQCEEGGRWHVRSETYDGGLGISHRSWNTYRPWWADPIEWRATALQQIYTARHLQAANGAANFVPDQNGGCAPW